MLAWNLSFITCKQIAIIKQSIDEIKLELNKIPATKLKTKIAINNIFPHNFFVGQEVIIYFNKSSSSQESRADLLSTICSLWFRLSAVVLITFVIMLSPSITLFVFLKYASVFS